MAMIRSAQTTKAPVASGRLMPWVAASSAAPGVHQAVSTGSR